MARKLLRKVQLMGGSTYVVSLPKDWAVRHGITRGSTIYIHPLPDGSLRITPISIEEGPRPPSKAVIEVDGTHTARCLVRKITAHYVAGYNMIHIVFKSPISRDVYEEVSRAVSNKIIGAEILSESEKEVIIHVLVNIRELSADEIIRKMAATVLSMVNECRTLYKSENPSPERFAEIAARDDLVDKLYLYALRQLCAVLQGAVMPEEVGLDSLNCVLAYSSVYENIERIADHIAESARRCSEFKVSGESAKVMRHIAGYAADVRTFFEKSVRAFMEFDVDAASRLLDSMPDVLLERERAIVPMLSSLPVEEASRLRLVLLNIRRVVDYSSNILEDVLNVYACKSLAGKRF